MLNELKNSFLIASPVMTDERFAKTVILLLEHRAEGSFGLVLNKEGEFSLSEACEQLECPPPKRDIAFGWGGPVHPMMAFVLHTTQGQWLRTDFENPKTGIALTVSDDILRAAAGGKGPDKIYPVLGCAMWDAGQLEAEIREGAWFCAQSSPRIVFDLPCSQRYEAALALVGNEALGDEHVLVSDEIGHA